MRFELMFYSVVGAFLILLMLLMARFWHIDKGASTTPKPPRRQREPKPFAGYISKPECEWCEQQVQVLPRAPSASPPRMIFTRGRRRHVDTTGHFCPHATCSYHGRIDLGNIRANGHPNGRRWRQLLCLSCKRHFLETHGTLFHGKQVDPGSFRAQLTVSVNPLVVVG